MGFLMMSRSEARARGLKRFFNGRPCANGHVAERRVGNGYCVRCSVERTAKWRRDNPERAKAQTIRAYVSKQDEVRERSRVWAASNADRRREISKKWADSHKDEMALYRLSVRARRSGCIDDLTLDELKSIRAEQTECRYCGRPDKLSFDHVISLAKGGPNTKTNIQILCLPCNSAKSVTDEAEFLARRSAA